MKAKEYAAKFANLTTDEEFKNKAFEMLKEFAAEFKQICEVRGVKLVRGEEGVVRELNEKWNSVAYQVEKMYNQPIIKRNVPYNIFLSDTDPVRWPPKPDGGAA